MLFHEGFLSVIKKSIHEGYIEETKRQRVLMIRNSSQDPEGKQNLEPAASTMYTHSIPDVTTINIRFLIKRNIELMNNHHNLEKVKVTVRILSLPSSMTS